VAAAGLCHSDVGDLTGNGAVAFAPITLGHEIARTVAVVGSGASSWRPGDRVAVMATPQGRAAACAEGRVTGRLVAVR
jgi:D-arabinose 1-dehydrogenase-like Zn-dependent alcohol dehydrogenase